MPRWVMSTDVDPPERTSRSGICAATASRSVFFFAPVGSHAVFAASGARWPSAEKVICEPRSSRMSPQVSASHRPEPPRFALDGVQRPRLLVVRQRVRVDGVRFRPVRGGSTACRTSGAGAGATASRQRHPEVCRRPAPELLELAAGDDRHLDALARARSAVRRSAGRWGSWTARACRRGRMRQDGEGCCQQAFRSRCSCLGGRCERLRLAAEPLCCRGDRI